MFLKRRLGLFRFSILLAATVKPPFTVDDDGLLMLSTLLALHPQGCCTLVVADKTHALVKRLALVGAARPPGVALLNHRRADKHASGRD